MRKDQGGDGEGRGTYWNTLYSFHFIRYFSPLHRCTNAKRATSLQAMERGPGVRNASLYRRVSNATNLTI
jgi:hypothetical protein